MILSAFIDDYQPKGSPAGTSLEERGGYSLPPPRASAQRALKRGAQRAHIQRANGARRATAGSPSGDRREPHRGRLGACSGGARAAHKGNRARQGRTYRKKYEYIGGILGVYRGCMWGMLPPLLAHKWRQKCRRVSRKSGGEHPHIYRYLYPPMQVPIYSYCGRLPIRRNEVRQERQPPPGCPFAVPERSQHQSLFQ